MSEIKKIKHEASAVASAVQRVGLVAMSAAMAFSLLELQDDAKRMILPSQPAPVWAEAGGGQGGDNNPIRREREETAPHFISYSEVQRTPSRSGHT